MVGGVIMTVSWLMNERGWGLLWSCKGHFDDLKRTKDELESSAKHYKKLSANLRDDNERLKVCAPVMPYGIHKLLYLSSSSSSPLPSDQGTGVGASQLAASG